MKLDARFFILRKEDVNSFLITLLTITIQELSKNVWITKNFASLSCIYSFNEA